MVSVLRWNGVFGQRGEIRKRYREGQEDQLGALGLVTNAVVLWNTLYMQEVLSWMRRNGEEIIDEDIARLSPLMHGHINMLGHYTFTLPEDISSRQPGGCGLSWSEITVIKTGNIIVFQVVIWPVQLNPVNENLPHNEANFPAMS